MSTPVVVRCASCLMVQYLPASFQCRKCNAPLEAPVDELGERLALRFSPRQLGVVGLVCEGHRNKEIAQRIGTTEQVVKNYCKQVFDVVGVDNRTALAVFVVLHPALNKAAAAAANLARPANA